MSKKKPKPSQELQRDPDLVSAEAAMKRAAIKAREVARLTGTALVIMENEIIREEYPESLPSED